MTYAEAQLFEMLAWALRDHAEIVSGAYKFSKMQRGCEKSPENPSGWRDLTDDEKLQDAMGRLGRRCEFIMRCADVIGR